MSRHNRRRARYRAGRSMLWHIALVAVCVGTLTLSACGSRFIALLQTPTPAAATATPLAPLAWTPVTLPTSFAGPGEQLAISPVDGYDAWMCQSTGANAYVIWQTTDAGQSWRQTGRFSYTAPIAGAWCGLTADQTGTSALLATIGWGCGECGTLASASLFSADGATHWTPLSGNVQNREFATVRGGVIAIVDKSPDTQQGEAQYLAFSSDGFQTWRAMSPQGLPTQFFHFAISPDSSTLIGSGYSNTLWRSSDLGAHWTQLASHNGQTGLTTWLPQRSTFLLCGGDMSPSNELECSTDYGAHWNQVNILSYTTPCPVPGKCGQGVTTQTQQCRPSSIESDGTMIAQCLPSQTMPLPPSGPTSTIVYLLTLGATTWRPIGMTQCNISVVPASGPVWCANVTPNQLLGFATGQLPG
ncbi:MAG TPA: hypothetical protein VGR57_00120 [Ktedonobacterales bacterium]|nr:hypothetical protein [Ktedonobacterales bacterium]